MLGSPSIFQTHKFELLLRSSPAVVEKRNERNLRLLMSGNRTTLFINE